MKRAITLKPPKSTAAKAVDRDNPPWSEKMLGPPVMRRGRGNKFPRGWDEKRVRRVLSHYEQQTEEKAVAEDVTSFEDMTQVVMEVPKELVPAIRELIAKHRARRDPE